MEEIQEQFLPLAGGAGDTARSPGLHVSHIIKDIMVDLYPKRFKRNEEEIPWALMEMGFVWEEVISLGLVKRFFVDDVIFQPGEIELDMNGTTCYMTPDGYHVKDDCVEEYKFTKASARKDIDDPFFMHWVMQTQAYCLGMGCLMSRFRILFVNGDYKEKRDPLVRVWNVSFTPRELDENWDMLTNHAISKGWV